MLVEKATVPVAVWDAFGDRIVWGKSVVDVHAPVLEVHNSPSHENTLKFCFVPKVRYQAGCRLVWC